MKKDKIKIFVAMSGGVDSSVAALLLKKEGYDLTGCYIKGWYPSGMNCGWREDRRDAMRVCAKLGIPFMTIDAEKEYKKEVVDYMIREYKACRTPNPDVMCNKHVKFGIFLKKAKKLGADFIATGHYVRLQRKFSIINNQFTNKKQNSKFENLNIENSLKIVNCELKIATDLNKDQSYFLWTLNQKQLKHCLFPLGSLTKSEVREIARKNNLITAEKAESMGVCFIGEFKMEDFLKKYIKTRKGDVVTRDGEKIGEHEGVVFYTIGQRHGFGQQGGGMPYYIVEKNIKKNILIVADNVDEKKFYKEEVEIENANWISGEPPLGDTISKLYRARIRYRQPLQNCKVRGTRNGVRVIFTKPQRAVTSGQSLVIYDGKKMLGGGVIK